MKNLVFVLFLAVLLFAVVGWFLDWYSIADLHSSSGRHRLQIEVDTNKIRSDLDKGQAKFQETIERVQQGANNPPAQGLANPGEGAPKDDAATSPRSPELHGPPKPDGR